MLKFHTQHLPAESEKMKKIEHYSKHVQCDKICINDGKIQTFTWVKKLIHSTGMQKRVFGERYF